MKRVFWLLLNLLFVGCAFMGKRPTVAPAEARSQYYFLVGHEALDLAPIEIEMDLARSDKSSFRIHKNSKEVYVQAFPITVPLLLSHLKVAYSKDKNASEGQVRQQVAVVQKLIKQNSPKACFVVAMQSDSETIRDLKKWDVNLVQVDSKVDEDLDFLTSDEIGKKYGPAFSQVEHIRDPKNYPYFVSSIACAKKSIQFELAFTLLITGRFRKNIQPIRLVWEKSQNISQPL